MDIDLVLHRFIYVYGSCVVIFVCFFSTQFYIKSSRKDDKEPAGKAEKIAMWIASVFILTIVSLIYAWSRKNRLSEFIAAFIIMFIPVAYGIRYGFQKDSKLTVEERKRIKKEIEDLNRFE